MGWQEEVGREIRRDKAKRAITCLPLMCPVKRNSHGKLTDLQVEMIIQF